MIEWIPVSDRTPENGEEALLLWVKYENREDRAELGLRYGNRWMLFGDSTEDGAVMFWAEINPPAK